MARQIKLRGPWEKSAGWARVLEDGQIELELYDFSPEAQDHMGNDVAWLYRIETVHKPRLRELLQERSGSAIRTDSAMLQAFQKDFPHVRAVREWLKEKQIPYKEEFDSWA